MMQLPTLLSRSCVYTWQVLALGLRVLTASYVAAKYVLQLMQRDDKMHLIIQMIHVFLDE